MRNKINTLQGNGLLTTALGAIFWGLSGCFGQYLFDEKGINAPWLVAVRLVMSGFILVVIGFVKNGRQSITIFKSKQGRISLLKFAFPGLLLCQMSYFLAVQYANAGTATVLQSTAPLLVLIFDCIRERHLPHKADVFSVLVVLCGVYLLCTHGNPGEMTISASALLFGGLAGASSSFCSVMSVKLVPRYGACQTIGWGMLISGIVLSIFVQPWQQLPVFDVQTVGALLGVIILGSVLAYALFLKGSSMIGPFSALLIGSLEPMVAIFVTVFYLKTAFTVIDAVGVLFILGAVIAMGLRPKKVTKRA